jgi:hypothetical protein
MQSISVAELRRQRVDFLGQFARKLGLRHHGRNWRAEALSHLTEVAGVARLTTTHNVLRGNRNFSPETVDAIKAHVRSRSRLRGPLPYECLLNPDRDSRGAARRKGGFHRRSEPESLRGPVFAMSLRQRRETCFSITVRFKGGRSKTLRGVTQIRFNTTS